MAEFECHSPRLFKGAPVYCEGVKLSDKQQQLCYIIKKNEKKLLDQVYKQFKAAAIILKDKNHDRDTIKRYDELIKYPEKEVSIDSISINYDGNEFTLLSEVWAGMWQIEMKFDKNCKRIGNPWKSKQTSY